MFDSLGLSLVTVGLGMMVAVFAGVVKGAVGFAMPLILVSGLSAIMDPKLALAGLIFPTLLTNWVQTLRQGLAAALAAVREYWRYLLIVCIAIGISAQAVAVIPARAFYFVLGVPVVGLSIIQLIGWRPHIPPDMRRRAEWAFGAISGLLGGFAGTWGPTTVLFLIATDTPKAKQMIVQGLIYGVGSVAFLLAHLNSGILTQTTAVLSAALLPAAMLGLWIGFKLQDRMDAERFRTATLIVLVVAGFNLLRKGIMG